MQTDLIRVVRIPVIKNIKLHIDTDTIFVLGKFGTNKLVSTNCCVFIKHKIMFAISNTPKQTNNKIINTIKGALTGHIKWLAIIGIGYKAKTFNNNLSLNLGFNHEIILKIPNKIIIHLIKQNKIKIKGPNLEEVTNLAKTIKERKKPNAYSLKGILYRYDHITPKLSKKK